MLTRPKIFISSTIHDFHDLRSALKYHLESLGYQVLLSEFNDFTKQLDLNSFHACLKSIETVDYFLLIIGSHVGVFYNEKNRTSITQMEYRKAYESARTGRLKLLVFVRQELWNLREDRNALREYLTSKFKTTHELSYNEIQEVVAHPSNLANDAEFLFAFLDEVSRLEETHKAMRGEGAFPVGNWVHTFATYQDILDALQVEFNFKSDIQTIALSENLRRELFSNLQCLTSKRNGIVSPKNMFAQPARTYYRGSLDEKSQIPSKYLHWVGIYVLLGLGSGERLTHQFIDQALTSGAFMQYDRGENRYRHGIISNALFDLKTNILRLRMIENDFNAERASLVNEFKNLASTDDLVPIDNRRLIWIFAAYDRQQDIVELCVGLIKALDGDRQYLSRLHLSPMSPLEGMDAELAKETPSTDELRDWIAEKST